MNRELAVLQALEARQLLTVAFDGGWATLPGTLSNLQGVSALVADMNNDGRADVVMAWDDTTRLLAVHLGNSSGTFAQVSAVFAGSPSRVRALGDFDGDGDNDAIVDSAFFMNNGGGVLIQQAADPLLAGTATLAVLDFDGDGRDEVASKDGTVLRLLQLQGAAFVETSSLTVGEAFSLAGDTSVVDLTGDGRFDLVLRASSPVPQTQLVFNDAGVLRLGPVLDGEATLADGTGDGVADRFTVSSRSDTSLEIYMATGAGNGTFGAAVLRDTLLPGWNSPSLTTLTPDVNGDGRPELIVTQILALEYSSTEVVLSNAAGRYVSGSSASGMGISSTQTGSRVLGAADFDGDGRLDLWGIEYSFGIDQTVTISRQVAGVTLTGLTASATSVRPLETLTLTATVDRGEADTFPLVEFYFDHDGDGRPSVADTLMGSVSTPDIDGAYRLAYVHSDTDPVGPTVIIAVARFGAVSPALSTTVTMWGRIFYAEGFRNDASINEYLSIVNPNGRAVQYQLIARYEVGERDQVLATGEVAATTRGGVTIVERGRPENNLTRAGVGYALELQVDGEVGATFAHYDSFATSTTEVFSGGAGEALTRTTARRWSFADVSTSTFDFLLFYNPLLTDATVSFRFYDDAQGVVDHQVVVPALRRGGLALRDVATLTPGTRYAVTVESTVAIAAAHSHYRQDGAAWGATGTARSDVQILPGIEVRPSAVSTLSLFNTHTEAVTVTLATSYDAGVTVTRSIVVPAGRRATVNPLESAPGGATIASLRLSGLLVPDVDAAEVLVSMSTEDLVRGDLIAGGPTGVTAPTWAFGDAFLAKASAGTLEFETLIVYNDTDAQQDVVVRYYFLNGTTAQRALTVPARGTSRVLLDAEAVITDFAPQTWYGISVAGEGNIVASLTHWDLSQGGGWVTRGTPVVIPLAPGDPG